MQTRVSRIQTGIEGLDDLLHGGLLEGDSMLLAGAPGSGKTSLGIQFLFNGATLYNEPGVLITFEEFPERIYRDAANYGWNLPKLEKENKLKVIFTSPDLLQQDLLNEQGIIPEMIHEIGARRAVLDSISYFESRPGLHDTRREALYGMINALKREGLTSLLLRELPGEEQLGSAVEDFLADGLILLSQKRVEGQRMRFIEVMKSRGSAHIQAPGLMLIGQNGLTVVPAHRKAFYRFEEAVSTGLPKLDDMLGGGIPYGACYLMEIFHDFHHHLIEANFLKETLESGDIWIHLGNGPEFPQDLRSLAMGLGLTPMIIEEAIRQGSLKLFESLSPNGEAQGTISTEDAVNLIEDIFENSRGRQKIRLQLDLSPLLISLGLDKTLDLVARIKAASANHGGVCLAMIQPLLAEQEAMEKLRVLSEGNVRIWREGDFDYLQVMKTINSVRTTIAPILEIPNPPYLEILS